MTSLRLVNAAAAHREKSGFSNAWLGGYPEIRTYVRVFDCFLRVINRFSSLVAGTIHAINLVPLDGGTAFCRNPIAGVQDEYELPS